MGIVTKMNYGKFIEFVESLSLQKRASIWYLMDIVAMALSSMFSYLILEHAIASAVDTYMIYTLVLIVSYILLSKLARYDKKMKRYAGIMDVTTWSIMLIVSGLVSWLLCVTTLHVSIRYVVLTVLLTIFGAVIPRILWHLIYARKSMTEHTPFVKDNNSDKREEHRVIVVGAGTGGQVFLENYKKHPGNLNVVALVDRDENKQGSMVCGIKVEGTQHDLPRLIKQYEPDEVIVAIPTLSGEDYAELVEICRENHVKIYKMPKVNDILKGKYRISQVKQVDIADVLGRKEVELDETKLYGELQGKVVLITGAGGSIGSEICRRVLACAPRKLILVGHGENSIYLIYHELLEKKGMTQIKPVIADIQDYERILSLFERERPHVVYHAAAHKHVPMMEFNPREAVKNNVRGTYNVAKAVHEAKVKKMVMISTDKAVNPPNVMGSTKRIAELIVTGFNEISKSTYCAVRFGNVLGSRGSVIPRFMQQIEEGGPVTVTDFRMTRYFMTIPEASRLVLHAGTYAKGGEVFLLDMGEPVYIKDLAEKLIWLSGHTLDEIPIISTGIRPGEKLYEELITDEEHIGTKLQEKIFVGKVKVKPLEEVMEFVDGLNAMSDDDLKTAVVEYANQN